jgi:hypothetical protein
MVDDQGWAKRAFLLLIGSWIGNPVSIGQNEAIVIAYKGVFFDVVPAVTGSVHVEFRIVKPQFYGG